MSVSNLMKRLAATCLFGTLLTAYFPITAFAEGPPLYIFKIHGIALLEGGDATNQSYCYSSSPNPYTDGAGAVGAGAMGIRQEDIPIPCRIGTTVNQTEPINMFSQDGRKTLKGSGSATGVANAMEIKATASASFNNDPGNQGVFTSSAMTYYQQNITSPVPIGGNLQFQYNVTGSGTGSVRVIVGSDSDPLRPGSLVRAEVSSPVDGQGNIIPGPIKTPPLTVGRSGQYSIRIVVGANANYDGPQTTTISISRGCDLAAIDIPSPGTLTAGPWSMGYHISDKDGLVVTDIKLDGRFMASKISVPYLKIDVGNFSGPHCELRPDSDASTCRSRLVSFNADASSLDAVYVIDHIDTGQGSSCLQVNQHFDFKDYTRGCEPSFLLKCARFYPMTSYTYVPDDPSKQVNEVTIAQRLQFSVDGANANTASLLQDLDPGPTANSVFGNPMVSAVSADAIIGGHLGAVDNIHQTSNPAGVQEPGVDLTRGREGAGPGCPECVHIHWRWSSFFGQLYGNGVPLIPSGSNQDVKVAVLASGGEEEHPGTDYTPFLGASLVNRPLSFWYIGTGHQQSDTFFTHGGFFAPQTRQQFQDSVIKVIRRGISAIRPGVFAQSVTLQNVSGSPIAGPLILALDSLPSGITLANANGTTQFNAPLGSPYVVVNLGATNELVSGASKNLSLSFNNPNRVGITYSTRVFGSGLP
ncbi:MAG: hypothetical protein JNK95_02060 [Candidatus Competibacter sp.]|nr:hypothetical protein [Candidatus Competibacter sp.]HRD48908.1 hypothetical protein [Candidatus Contendobacter sp.]